MLFVKTHSLLCGNKMLFYLEFINNNLLYYFNYRQELKNKKLNLWRKNLNPSRKKFHPLLPKKTNFPIFPETTAPDNFTTTLEISQPPLNISQPPPPPLNFSTPLENAHPPENMSTLLETISTP